MVIIFKDENAPRFCRLHSLFEDPLTEVYLLFYHAVLQGFVRFNKFLQRNDPLIPVIHSQMISFLTKLAGKFLLPSTIIAAKGDFYTIAYKELYSQLPGNLNFNLFILNVYSCYSSFFLDQSVFIGLITQSTLRRCIEMGDLAPSQSKKFYDSVRAFYVSAFEYALKNLPLNDQLLKNANFVNFTSRTDSAFTQIEYFVERYIN